MTSTHTDTEISNYAPLVLPTNVEYFWWGIRKCEWVIVQEAGNKWIEWSFMGKVTHWLLKSTIYSTTHFLFSQNKRAATGEMYFNLLELSSLFRTLFHTQQVAFILSTHTHTKEWSKELIPQIESLREQPKVTDKFWQDTILVAPSHYSQPCIVLFFSQVPSACTVLLSIKEKKDGDNHSLETHAFALHESLAVCLLSWISSPLLYSSHIVFQAEINSLSPMFLLWKWLTFATR